MTRRRHTKITSAQHRIDDIMDILIITVTVNAERAIVKDIIARRMQAEADANDDKTAKHLTQSSGQQVQQGADQPSADDLLFPQAENAPVLEQTSGDAIREALLRRAKAKQMGMDEKLNFASSKIGSGGYRKATFEQADDEGRKSILGTANAKRKREKEKRDRLTNRDKKQRLNATGELDSDTPAPDTETRQSFNSHRNSFNEPTGRSFNPYA